MEDVGRLARVSVDLGMTELIGWMMRVAEEGLLGLDLLRLVFDFLAGHPVGFALEYGLEMAVQLLNLVVGGD